MLYVVATPIGNLGDISARALEVLGSVDAVLCEDTRRTSMMLNHFNIKRPLISFHSYTTDKKQEALLREMDSGKNYALVSDAGTPGISDPGGILVSEAIAHGITVVPIPGAAAFLTALMASGLPLHRFWYYGFLPAKKGRETLYKDFASKTEETIVCYESPHRLLATLGAWTKHMPDRRIVVARELTKMHEEFFRGTVAEAYANFSARTKILGEFVLILS